MESLALHIVAPTLKFEYNTSCISAVEDKTVTPRVKHIDIPVCFLQFIFDNGIFITKYEKSSVILEYICTKSCSVTITSWGTK